MRTGHSWLRLPNLLLARSRSLRGRVVLYYFVFFALPLIILGTVFFVYAIDSLQADYRRSVEQVVDYIAENVNSRQRFYNTMLIGVGTNRELLDRLSRSYRTYRDYYETVTYLDSTFGRSAAPNVANVSLRLYVTNPTLTEDQGLLWSLKRLGGQNWVAELSEERWPRPYWVTSVDSSGRRQIQVVAALTKEGDTFLGVAALNVDPADLFAGLGDATLRTEGPSRLLLTDASGLVLASSDGKDTGLSLRQLGVSEGAPEGISDAHMVSVGGEQMLVTYRLLDSGWRVAALTPLSHMRERTTAVFRGALVAGALFFGVSALFTFSLLNTVVRRIGVLTSLLSKVESGDYQARIAAPMEDEIGYLERQSNRMVERLDHMVREVYATQIRQREEELSLLQAQINPHFLYNTLGLIRWKAAALGSKELEDLVDAMATFYRLALSKGRQAIRISQEIELTKAYVQIQQRRFRDKITVEWHIHPDVLGFYTPKLVLQPIVENAYAHAFARKAPDCRLTITLERDGQAILMTVKDNGVGMSREQAASVLSQPREGAENGFGLHNIHERIGIYFGAGYGVSLSSVPGEGTAVQVRIPLCPTPALVSNVEETSYASSDDR